MGPDGNVLGCVIVIPCSMVQLAYKLHLQRTPSFLRRSVNGDGMHAHCTVLRDCAEPVPSQLPAGQGRLYRDDS